MRTSPPDQTAAAHHHDEPADASFTTADPLGLFRALEASGRFRRDTPLGGMFHRGKISYREMSPTNSLHVIIDGSRVSAHVDAIAPLNCDPDASSQYSWSRVLAHNVAGLAGDMGRRLRGRHGEQRCNLECELVWVDDETISDLVTDPHHDAASGCHEEDHGPAAAEHAGDDAADPESSEQPHRVPFSVIDEAIHLLDTQAAPWSIQLEVRVAASLDEERLRKALARALSSHPMARARKVPARGTVHRDQWEIPETTDVEALRVVECPDDAALVAAREQLQRLAVPLSESPPLRARLARHPAGDVLMLNVNHAAMDGYGAMRVLQSIARAYSGEADPEPTLDFLEARELPLRLAHVGGPTRRRRLLVLAEKARDLVVPPARITPEGATGEPGYGFHHVSLSRPQTRAIVELGHDSTAGEGTGGEGTAGGGSTAEASTVNDVLLSALHLAIARWNGDHRTRCGRIGVLVPSNLRPHQWRQDMVGNFTLPARLATSRQDRRSPRATLDALTAKTRRRKRWGMGTALIELLSLTHLFPMWAKQAMVGILPVTGNRLVDTAMLSDLGELTEPPSFGPDAGETVEVWFSPPARMPLGVSVGAATFSDRLHLTFRYRHRQFGPDAARRFAEGFVAELEVLAGTTPFWQLKQPGNHAV